MVDRKQQNIQCTFEGQQSFPTRVTIRLVPVQIARELRNIDGQTHFQLFAPNSMPNFRWDHAFRCPITSQLCHAFHVRFHVSGIAYATDETKLWLSLTEVNAAKYSRLPITRTIANSNLALTRTKIDFPWISVIHSL